MRSCSSSCRTTSEFRRRRRSKANTLAGCHRSLCAYLIASEALRMTTHEHTIIIQLAVREQSVVTYQGSMHDEFKSVVSCHPQ